MGPAPTTIVGPDDDPLRTYSAEEQAQLTANLSRLLEKVHAGSYSSEAMDIALLEDLHRSIFGGVREHAGRRRAPGRGSEYVVFGPHRSFPHAQVEPALDKVFEDAKKSLRSLADNLDHADYDFAAIRLAAWVHAEVIRIHPFEDGNGRTARALMSLILVRTGMRPIAIESPKQEYLACLNQYYSAGDLDPFLDLCIRLYSTE